MTIKTTETRKDEKLIEFLFFKYCRAGALGFASLFGFKFLVWAGVDRCLFGFVWRVK